MFLPRQGWFSMQNSRPWTTVYLSNLFRVSGIRSMLERVILLVQNNKQTIALQLHKWDELKRNWTNHTVCVKSFLRFYTSFLRFIIDFLALFLCCIFTTYTCRCAITKLLTWIHNIRLCEVKGQRWGRGEPHGCMWPGKQRKVYNESKCLEWVLHYTTINYSTTHDYHFINVFILKVAADWLAWANGKMELCCS